MAMTPNLRAPFPTPAAPMVDPATGILTDVWLQFLLSQFARSGGAVGPVGDLASIGATATAAGLTAADSEAMALFGDPAEAPPLDPLLGLLLGDAGEAAAAATIPDPDQATLLALALVD